jgi:hypothetical protein
MHGSVRLNSWLDSGNLERFRSRGVRDVAPGGGGEDHAAVGMAPSRCESRMRGSRELRREAALIEEQMLEVDGLLLKALAANFLKNGAHK